MRILQLVTRRQRRGAEVFASQLSDALVEAGHDVLFAGLYPASAAPLAPRVAPVRDLAGRPEERLSYALTVELGGLIREYGPDLVQANGSDTLKNASIAKRLTRGEWPLVYRNISVASLWVRSGAQRLWAQWLVRNVTHVAAVSRHSEADFRATYRLPEQRISTIPIGVEVPVSPPAPELRDRLLRSEGLPADAELLVHVGSFTPEKNHLWLLRAFRGILERRPKAHLLLVGDGPLRSRAEEAVRKEGFVDAVHFLGTRSDVSDILGGADLFVLASTIEGTPGAVLEAAAQALPAVATNVGCLADVVENGLSGLLVPPGDVDSFTSAVSSLLGDPERRRSMGHAAFELVGSRYSLSSAVAGFEALYSRLCARRTSEA